MSDERKRCARLHIHVTYLSQFEVTWYPFCMLRRSMDSRDNDDLAARGSASLRPLVSDVIQGLMWSYSRVDHHCFEAGDFLHVVVVLRV